jgi:hypothetical protein
MNTQPNITGPLKIVGLVAENLKRIKAVEIKPTSNIVELTGANGQGKTSILDGIWWALDGSGGIQKMPIRRGEEQAIIKLDLGELIVTRKFKRREKKEGDGPDAATYTTSITVTGADGSSYKSPQTILDNLVGALSIDPVGFARLSASEQFDELKKLVPGLDFTKIENLNRGDTERRRDAGRERDRLASAATSIVVPEVVPEWTNETDLLNTITSASQHNAAAEKEATRRAHEIERADAMVRTANEALIKTQEEIAKLEALLSVQSTRLGATEIEAEEIRKTVAELPMITVIDVTEVRAKLDKAKADNLIAEQAKRKNDLKAQADVKAAEYDAYTEAIRAREAEKQKAVAEAKLPVEGITFGAGELLFNGVPFDQASDADKTRVSLAIAMALNPDLHVIRVRDGSLLDSKSMKLVEEMANKHNYQIWMERVDESGAVGIVIEDGMVKAVNERAEDHATHVEANIAATKAIQGPAQPELI